MKKISEIDKDLLSSASKGGILLSERCKYIVYKNIGLVGVLEAKTSVVFKCAFVKENYRRRGIYQRLFQQRLEYCMKKKIRRITANVTKFSINTYLKNGFIIVKKYKNGVCKVSKHYEY